MGSQQWPYEIAAWTTGDVVAFAVASLLLGLLLGALGHRLYRRSLERASLGPMKTLVPLRGPKPPFPMKVEVVLPSAHGRPARGVPEPNPQT